MNNVLELKGKRFVQESKKGNGGSQMDGESFKQNDDDQSEKDVDM